MSTPDFAPPLPATVAEAVERLLVVLEPEALATVAGTDENELFNLHFGLGLWIRNAWLWHKRNPALLADCARIKWAGRLELPEGFTAIHPDDASGIIIRALWERLRSRDIKKPHEWIYCG